MCDIGYRPNFDSAAVLSAKKGIKKSKKPSSSGSEEKAATAPQDEARYVGCYASEVSGIMILCCCSLSNTEKLLANIQR